MIGSRRMWIGVLALVVGITAVLVGANQWRVASRRQVRRAEASNKADVRRQLFTEIQPVHVTNCELKRFGEPHDGGYPLCANLLGAVKAGYSYGISGYDGWDSFLFAPDSVFAHIDQLDVEFHHVEDPKFVAAMERLKQFFYVAHVHYNNFSCDPAIGPFPSWAFEVLLVNKRIAMTDGSPVPASDGVVDAANNPAWPDCQPAARGAL